MKSPSDCGLIEPSLATFRESYTLRGIAYTSPELFAWEMSHFFDDSWTCLGRTDSIVEHGSRKAIQVGLGCPGPICEMEEAVYLFFHMVASSYVAGRAVRPLKPVVPAKPPR